jgi:hypothetical protein
MRTELIAPPLPPPPPPEWLQFRKSIKEGRHMGAGINWISFSNQQAWKKLIYLFLSIKTFCLQVFLYQWWSRIPLAFLRFRILWITLIRVQGAACQYAQQREELSSCLLTWTGNGQLMSIRHVGAATRGTRINRDAFYSHYYRLLL